jgi:hypothetical protein
MKVRNPKSPLKGFQLLVLISSLIVFSCRMGIDLNRRTAPIINNNKRQIIVRPSMVFRAILSFSNLILSILL